MHWRATWGLYRAQRPDWWDRTANLLISRWPAPPRERGLTSSAFPHLFPETQTKHLSKCWVLLWNDHMISNKIMAWYYMKSGRHPFFFFCKILIFLICAMVLYAENYMGHGSDEIRWQLLADQVWFLTNFRSELFWLQFKACKRCICPLQGPLAFKHTANCWHQMHVILF